MQESKKFVGCLLDSRYMVTDVIGRGGSACVYRANDVLLNRAVALKILEDDKNELRINTKSFETEVRAIARLSHPNIVNVYDISMEGNTKYIVMEYVEGITLATYLKHKKILPISEAVSCAKQVLRALREAHEKGIVHRDIKPQNIMIMKNGQIKVADFGIARLPDKDSFRMQDRSIGTVHYISPEQAKGNAVDPRSDLYSLAIVLYESLTGKRPFEAPLASDVVMMQVTETPARPSEINPEISPELDALVMRALSKRPENRYESASDMLRVLERINLSGERREIVKKSFFGFMKREKTLESGEREPEPEEEYVQPEDEQDENIDSGSAEKLAFDESVEYEEIDDAESGVFFSAGADEELTDGAYTESDAVEESDIAEEADAAEENSAEEADTVVESDTVEERSGYEAPIEEDKAEIKENTDGEDEFETEDVAREPAPYENYSFKKPKKKRAKRVEMPSKKTAVVLLASVFAAALIVLLSLLIYNANKLYPVPFYANGYFEEGGKDERFSIVVKREFSGVYPEGTVISQSVAGGERRKKGTEIVLTVSDGPASVRFSIPEGADVDNLLSQLKAQIEDGGYGITVETEYEYSGALERGQCFEIDEVVYEGGLLKVRVSAGKEKAYVEIPDFVGGALTDAVEFLSENNVVFEIDYSGEAGNVNTVLAQSIESGKRTEAYVEAGKIILTVGGRDN